MPNDTRYASHQLDEHQVARVEAIKQHAEALARLFDQTPSRESSVALTHLETAVMFGVRAVAKNR
jgi:hypothetical protein